MQTHGDVRLRDITRVFYHVDLDTSFLSHRGAIKELRTRRDKHKKDATYAKQVVPSAVTKVVLDEHTLHTLLLLLLLRDYAQAHFQTQEMFWCGG